jgi:arylsulfatase
MKTEPLQFSLCGEELCIGYDGGDVVSKLYRGKNKFEFKGGTILGVVFDVADDAYRDVEKAMAAAMSRD